MKIENPILTCSNYFGYLSQISPGKDTPDQCLMCGRLLECKLSKLDSTSRGMEPENIAIDKNLRSFEKPEVDIGTNAIELEPDLEISPGLLAEPPSIKPSGKEFVVDTLGMLYASWVGTVHINRETLSSWGEKINEVSVETNSGKKMRCKVMPSEDQRKGIVLIPDKILLNLEVRKGDHVRIEPVIVLEKDKPRDISQVLSNLKKITLKIVKQLKRLKLSEKDRA